jgi:hypothetical protein
MTPAANVSPESGTEEGRPSASSQAVTRDPAEMERIARAAREAKTTVLVVGALGIGGIVLMFVITIVFVLLRT